MAKNYMIRKHQLRLKSGKVVKGYTVSVKHPDTRHLITRNFLKKADAEQWAKMMSN